MQYSSENNLVAFQHPFRPPWSLTVKMCYFMNTEQTFIALPAGAFSHLDDNTTSWWEWILFRLVRKYKFENSPQSSVWVDNSRPRSVRFVKQIFEWGKVAMVTVCHLSMAWSVFLYFSVVCSLFLVAFSCTPSLSHNTHRLERHMHLLKTEYMCERGTEISCHAVTGCKKWN